MQVSDDYAESHVTCQVALLRKRSFQAHSGSSSKASVMVQDMNRKVHTGKDDMSSLKLILLDDSRLDRIVKLPLADPLESFNMVFVYFVRRIIHSWQFHVVLQLPENIADAIG